MNCMTDEKVLIDSNILIYAYDFDEKTKNNLAKTILEKILNNKINIVLSTQNLSEFYVNVTKKIEKPIPQNLAKTIIKDLSELSNTTILKINPSTILGAIETSIKFNVSYWDSLISAVMLENNVYKIVTENLKDFAKIPGIIAINPFATNN